MCDGQPLDCRLQCECCGYVYSDTINDHTLESECPTCGSFDTLVIEQ